MPRNYNFIYSKLVEDENDILGVIAYAIYKKQKIEHIEEFKRDNNREPTDLELVQFNKFSTSKASLDGYRIKAELILQSFTDYVLEDTLEEIENECKKNQSEILQKIIDPISPPSKLRSFSSGVLHSVVGTFVFSIIIAAFVIINQTREKGVESVIENTFNVKIQKKPVQKTDLPPDDTLGQKKIQ
jgi:hypothetical protein